MAEAQGLRIISVLVLIGLIFEVGLMVLLLTGAFGWPPELYLR